MDKLIHRLLLLMISLPVTAVAGIYNPPTELVELTGEDREFITMALEQREEGLSDRIDLDAVEAERRIGEDNSAFFHANYEVGPVDDTYTQVQEMYCERNPELGGSWDCLEGDKALSFTTDGTIQIVWIVGLIEIPEAIRIIEFLKTQPEYPCLYIHGREKPCMEIFDGEKLKEVRLIRHSYINKMPTK